MASRPCLTTPPAVALAVLALTPATALAQDSVVTAPVVIIAGGIAPVAQDEYGRAATTLSGAALREAGVQTLADALATVPGLAVNATDLSDPKVRIRGHNAAQTLILIDGVEQIADLGGTPLGGLDLADIDRIEVLRGPQAASFGTGASGGVVSIWTRRGAEGLHYGGAVMGGSATGAAAHVSQRGARGGIMLAAEWRDDDGWDLSGEGGERDGLTHRGLRLTGDFAPTDELTLGFSLRRVREDYRFDSTAFAPTGEADYIYDDRFPHGRSDRRQGQLWAEYRQMDGRLTHRLSYDEARDERVTAFAAAYDPSRAETRRQSLRYRLSYALDNQPVEAAAQVVSLMAERVRDDSPLDDRYRRATNSVALEYRGDLRPGLSVQLAVRRDDNDSYADTTSWNAALVWALPDSGVRLHASAGDGRRKPVFYELFGDGSYTLPNPDLRSERVRSVDAGVTVPLAGDRGSADITAFAERYTGRIAYVMQPDFTGIYRNEDGTSHRRGVEASVQWRAGDQLTLTGRAGYVHSKDADGEAELRVPRQQVALGARWTSADGRLSLGGDLRHVAGLRDTDRATRQTVQLDDYTLLDLSGQWAINERAALTARIENVADAAHVDAWGYASRGRVIHVGLGANF